MSPSDIRYYLCPTEEQPDRRKTIVRDGEVLIGRVEGEHSESDRSLGELQGPEEVLTGARIQHDLKRKDWRARVPGIGYLQELPDGRLMVVPAIEIDEDRLEATIDLRPPTGTEDPISRYEVDVAIDAAGIRFGLDQDLVDEAWKIFQASGSLPVPMPIAHGTPPRAGNPAGIKYFLEVQSDPEADSKPNDQIDFRAQNKVINVHRLQEIGRWLPAIPPAPGKGVDGREVPPKPLGDDVSLRVGKNIRTREDKNGTTLLLSAIEGVLITAEDGIPSVTDHLEIEGDVDLHTGNLIVNGSVTVAGSVRSGFLIDARCDITVRETVEGADLRAKGNIAIGGGLIGEGDSQVVAGGNVTVKYSQNARIVAGGDVEVRGSETAGLIECRGSIRATDGKGRLQGGRYRAGQNLLVKELGSELGVPTFASAGKDPLTEAEVLLTREKLKAVNEGDRGQRSASAGQSPGAGRSRSEDPAKQRRLLNARLLKLNEAAGAGNAATITVQGKAYYGVEIAIGRQSLVLEETMISPRFTVDPETKAIVP